MLIFATSDMNKEAKSFFSEISTIDRVEKIEFLIEKNAENGSEI